MRGLAKKRKARGSGRTGGESRRGGKESERARGRGGKYPSIPTPGGETSLDGDTLRSEGAAEKDVLIEQLREDLEQSSRRNMMERSSEEAQFQQDTINKVPLNIYIG